ncbi:hypothetical protein ACIHCQ_35370 [Streptomyces sp. NPDC052236]|uniref:hypothetical protein n=1 Tax=Streptomyces sp. NPDC052236 TaxID=3365686 RepID=UPI0037CDDD74
MSRFRVEFYDCIYARADLAVRTYLGETKDTVAVYAGEKRRLVAAKPQVTFSTAAFLGMD